MNSVITRTDVSRETFLHLDEVFSQNSQSLENYIDLLLEINQRVNLISRKLTRDEVVQHVKHSLLPGMLFNFQYNRVWDSGTGGGLPGIPLSILFPDFTFVLHDRSTKKLKAIEQIVNRLNLINCEFRDDDLNNVSEPNAVSLVSKHAYKLHDFFKRSRKINWKEAFFFKGDDFETELPSSLPAKLLIQAYPLFRGGTFYEGKVILHITKSN